MIQLKKKYANLIAVTGLVALLGITSFNQPFKHAEASLSRPSTYHYFYAPIDNPSPAPDHWRLADWNGTSSPNSNNDTRYTRTVDGSYYNYSLTVNNSTDSFLPEGLEITMNFNRSNTSWTQVSGTSLYNPTDYNKIGSDSTVGTISNKVNLRFLNNTNKNFKLFVDLSSSASGIFSTISYSNDIYYNDYETTNFNVVYLPSFSDVNVYFTLGSASRYFDAWYLQDLGVSSAYTEGYDQGETDGYDTGYDTGYDLGFDEGEVVGNNTADSSVLIDAVETVVGISINFILMIMTLSIFDISLMNIFLALIAVLGVIWILKALRG
jgi:hypothetical protein